MKIIRLAAAAAAIATIAGAQPAAAHAMLKTAAPAVGSTVTTAPKSVELDFSEGVVPRFSDVAVRNAAGKLVSAGKAANGAGPASLVVPLAGKLPPGVYAVTWHAVSVDTHRTQGSFRFTVAP